MSTIPKLIKDTEKYFQYEGSANPTTQDELQAYMKNEHSVVECLTDALWQPETVYTIGHIVKSPNMPKGFQAVCLVNGTSSSNEPDWGSGATDITDGSTKWKVTTANITVNGISPDASGNISITSVTNATNATNAENATNATNATKATQDSAGQQINTTYIKGLSVSGRTITYTKGNGTTGTITTQDNGITTGSNITVTKSTQANRRIRGVFASVEGNDEKITVGQCYKYEKTYFKTLTGIAAGTYTLQNLLQQLVNKSHTHTAGIEEVNCNCSDNCIIDGNILTDSGYKHISQLQINDCVIDNDNKPHKVLGIKTSKVKNRKAVFFAGIPSAVLTDDHLVLLSDNNYGTYDIQGYYKESKENCTDGNVYGTYSRLEDNDIIDLSKNNCVIKYNGKDYGTYLCEKKLPYDTVTYLPIVEDCEWVILNGIIVACARYVKQCY